MLTSANPSRKNRHIDATTVIVHLTENNRCYKSKVVSLPSNKRCQMEAELPYFDAKILDQKPFFIAEIGQNHQGDLELAKSLLREFARVGASAVKFQMRDNRMLFSKNNYNRVYDSENAFAATYGEHREQLELTTDEFKALHELAASLNCAFMVTPFDEMSLKNIIELDVDIIKIASFDLGNIPFIEKICKYNKPTVLSVGGGKPEQIKASVDILSSLDDFAILHCVSEYPCPANRLNLSQISSLKTAYPQAVIGVSDHFSGISSGPVSYMLGARVFEKHVTFNRAAKGTDHAFSLLPEGFRKFVRDVHNTSAMLKEPQDHNLGEEPVFQKLGKKLIASEDINAGARISSNNLSFVITEEAGIAVRDSYTVINKFAKNKIRKGDTIKSNDLSD